MGNKQSRATRQRDEIRCTQLGVLTFHVFLTTSPSSSFFSLDSQLNRSR